MICGDAARSNWRALFKTFVAATGVCFIPLDCRDHYPSQDSEPVSEYVPRGWQTIRVSLHAGLGRNSNLGKEMIRTPDIPICEQQAYLIDIL